MVVEERYEVVIPSLNGYAYIHDFKTDNVLNTYDSCDLINQQDKRIKELEHETKQLKQQLEHTEESYNRTMAYLNTKRSELLNLPKKIVKEIENELLSEFSGSNDYEHKYYIITKRILPRILKKYGGEYEN